MENIHPPEHVYGSHAEAGSSPGFRLKPSQKASRGNPPESSKRRLSSSNPVGSENPESNGSTTEGSLWEAVWLRVQQPSQRRDFQTPSCDRHSVRWRPRGSSSTPRSFHTTITPSGARQTANSIQVKPFLSFSD